MSLSLSQSVTAVVPGLYGSFLGVGGATPYSYAVIAGGAGGTINGSTGEYTAPTVVSPNPLQLYDTVQVTDAAAATATAKILVGTPLLLFCEIIQREMGLSSDRVYLWDQKLFQPIDNDLYIAISVPSAKPFANTVKTDGSGSGLKAIQVVNMLATIDIDILSRGPAARDRKEEVVLAFNSIYAQSQQEINSFYIGKLPPGARFLNLSEVDGAAIPYRYRISVNLQYAVTKTKAVPYFDTFENAAVTTNP